MVMPLSRLLSVAVAAVCILAVSASSPARAQEVRTITFNEAVRIALDQNIALRQAENITELRSINVSRQRMNFLPSLNLSSNGRQTYGRTFSQTEGVVVDQLARNFSAGLDASVNVFRGFGDVASYEQSQYMRDAGLLTYEWQRQTTVFNVMSSYLTLIERREQIRIQEENLESQMRQLEQIREFTEVGSRPISDLYQQQAAVAAAELEVLRAQRLYQIGEATMIQILQLDPLGNYDFEAPTVDDLELETTDFRPGQLLREAFQQRSDLEARALNIRAAEQGIRAARSTYWPSVNLSGGVGSSYSNLRLLSFQDQFFDSNRSGSLGLSLSFPIFDRFNTRNNVQQARVEYNNSQLALEDTRQDIAVQVRQAYLDYLTAEKQLDVTEKQLQAANQALEAEQERYNLGAATLVELSQARAAQVQASSNWVQARYDFLFQEKLLDYYTGKLDPSQSLFD